MHFVFAIIKARRVYLLAFLALIIVLFSCNADPISPVVVKDRSIIFYIVADNNLRPFAQSFVSEIEKALPNENNTNIILYLDDKDDSSLFVNEDGRLVQRNSYGKINSLSKENMFYVLDEINQKYPAKETGIIFWSHGTGWLSTGLRTRSFGDDSGEAMDISELSESLPREYDYVIFDACYMGCIEVAVEFEGKCSYFLSAPSVVPLEGILDSESLFLLFQNTSLESRLLGICDVYDKKCNKTDEYYPASLIKMEVINRFISSIGLLSIPVDIDIDGVLQYPFRGHHVFYDIKSLFCQLNNEDSLSSLDEFVLFPIDKKQNNSNLSVFIPSNLNIDYWQNYSYLKWNTRTEWLTKWHDCK